MLRRDPLANPEELIRRVYAYVAYRIGDGPEAEDVTSDTFERALRYRRKYDASRGEPIAWLIGIARRCMSDALKLRYAGSLDGFDVAAGGDLEEEAIRRLEVANAVASLDERDRELVALRYGADLTARQIAKIVGANTNSVEVALHRALARLRPLLEQTAGEVRAARPQRRPAAL
jgi:RNA polymerase sigma-70 factor (ECF subfamily)